jgi:hypothetical protein
MSRYCDACNRKDPPKYYHLDPNFDLCSTCYSRGQLGYLDTDKVARAFEKILPYMKFNSVEQRVEEEEEEGKNHAKR